MMMSPLWHSSFMGTRIDLSALVEVGDPWFATMAFTSGESYHPGVGFHYRLGGAAKEITYKRPLKQGPVRNKDLSLKDPADMLLTIREETFRIEGADRWDSPIILYCEDAPKTPIALKHIRQEQENLVSAWTRWKAIEPEVYAIIREKLG